jgi:hypothetical protein
MAAIAGLLAGRTGIGCRTLRRGGVPTARRSRRSVGVPILRSDGAGQGSRLRIVALGRVRAGKTVTIDVPDTDLIVTCDDGPRTIRRGNRLVTSGGRRRRKHPLLAVVVLPVGKLGQYVGRITATAISQASQLVSVAPLARQLNELVDGITAAVIGKTAQLIHVTPLARQLDELVNGVSVTGRRTRPQVQQIPISHAQ